MFVIAGLGNPGKRYADTRHNIGFMTLDYIAHKYNVKVSKIKHKGLVGEFRIEGEKIVLLKPQTYMNLSGESLLDIVEFYKLAEENLIVIYDDVDLKTGAIRIRKKGGSGTHNGMRSIIYLLSSDGFPRIRIGIGKPPEYMDIADYVTSRFEKDEIELMETAVKNAADSAIEIIKNGIDLAMNKYNEKE